MKRVLEKEIERAVSRYASDKGILQYKFSSPAHAAVPDRIFHYEGLTWYIEFKASGEQATHAQKREHERLRRAGIPVFVIDNVSMGERVTDDMILRSVLC